MNWDVYIWLGLMVAFLIAETACPFHLISIWFAVGSLAALIIAMLGDVLWLKIVCFLVVSCALLAALWPLSRKFLNAKVEKTNVDSVIGSVGIVTAAIDNVEAAGQVKLGAMYWTARSTDGQPIAEGRRVRVDKIEGGKVFVSTVEVKA